MDTYEIEKIIDGKTNRSNLGKAWTITKFLSAVTWLTGKFIVKNTPTILGVAWEAKKEFSRNIADLPNQYDKAQKKIKIEEKIHELTYKGNKNDLKK